MVRNIKVTSRPRNQSTVDNFKIWTILKFHLDIIYSRPPATVLVQEKQGTLDRHDTVYWYCESNLQELAK